jgi:hypothetical protein
VKNYAQQYGWDIINPANMKAKFMDMVKTMDMSFSYKPVLLKAMLEHVDENGRVLVEDIVNYCMDYYSARKEKGLVVEKKSSIFCKNGYTKKDVERNIFANPFKRFEDMRFMKRCKEVEDNNSLQRSALRWLRGEYSTKTEARGDLGVRDIIDDSNYYDYLKVIAQFVRQIGYSGLVINFDEAINLYKITHLEVHNSFKNLVVAATGTGKTVIAAFDYRDFCRANLGKPNKLLFVAHRKEILSQSLACFRGILKDINFGSMLVGGIKPDSFDHLFVSI